MSDLEEHAKQINKPRRLALYRDIKYGFYTVIEVPERPYGEYVQVTEPVVVNFPPLSDDTVVQNAVAACDEQERAVREDCNRKVAEIRERKATLLALTHQPESLE